MALSSKELRPVRTSSESEVLIEDSGDFDFGEPEIVSVEIAPGKFLELKEPSANDIIEIQKVYSKKDLTEIEYTIATICILHNPGENGKKLTLKDAKRLRSKQLKALGEAINHLMGIEKEEEDDSKSDDDEEL